MKHKICNANWCYAGMRFGSLCVNFIGSIRRKLGTHTYTHRTTMGTKNIAISDDAYQILRSLKKSGESFTDVIERIARRSSLLDLAGVLSETQAANVERRVREVRRQSSRRIGRTVGRTVEGLK